VTGENRIPGEGTHNRKPGRKTRKRSGDVKLISHRCRERKRHGKTQGGRSVRGDVIHTKGLGRIENKDTVNTKGRCGELETAAEVLEVKAGGKVMRQGREGGNLPVLAGREGSNTWRPSENGSAVG